MIIGFYADASRSGKSTAADYLVANHGFVRVKFSDTFKQMLRLLFHDLGFKTKDIERMMEGDLKTVPQPLLGMHSPVELQISLGQIWGRGHVSESVWIDTTFRAIQLLETSGQNVVMDDLRQTNEYDALGFLGGKRVKIVRCKDVEVRAVDGLLKDRPFDHVIENNGTLTELYAQLDEIVRKP